MPNDSITALNGTVLDAETVAGKSREAVCLTACTSGGTDHKHVVAAGGGDATIVKASGGQVYGVRIHNMAAYRVWVKLHNTSGTPTPGTGVVLGLSVQADSDQLYYFQNGLDKFPTGIGLTIVKDAADAGTTAVVAGDCVVGVSFR